MGGAGWAEAAATAMDFELPTLDGTKFVRLAEFDRHPVLLNFWGSECPPCIRELPLLAAQANRYPGVQFIGIATDERATAVRFFADMTHAYLQLAGPTRPEVMLRRFGNTSGALPYTVVLSAQHSICATRMGEVDAGWIAKAIATCTAAEAPAERH